MNFTALFVVGYLVFVGLVTHEEDRVSNMAREAFFNATIGVACGTLLGANIVLPFVACLFHDVNTMTVSLMWIVVGVRMKKYDMY